MSIQQFRKVSTQDARFPSAMISQNTPCVDFYKLRRKTFQFREPDQFIRHNHSTNRVDESLRATYFAVLAGGMWVDNADVGGQEEAAEPTGKVTKWGLKGRGDAAGAEPGGVCWV